MVKHAALNKKSNNSDNPDRKVTKGNMRSKSTIMRLNMYRTGKPVRNKEGKVVGGSLMMANTSGGKAIQNVARIAPNRRWFGNTRIISQNELDSFREEMTTKEADPYSIILRRKKIPMALLQESEKESRVKILETETFKSVFGKQMTRKRPTISNTLADYEAMMNNAATKATAYDLEPSKDSNVEVDINGDGNGILVRKEDMFSKGQSKRIWGELYKVLDCSDVILEIVDARNVPGTRCEHIENHIKKNASHKHLVIVLNKCDLVPNWVTRKWVKILSAKFPTLAFHASMTNAFGKGALISLLRQFSKLHSDKRQISVGVIGYPNSGKSSVINALMGKPCCKAAPVPGETKVWQYITLTKKIFLIDCPGVVYDVGDDEVETVLKGVVRAERLQNPADFVQPMLDRVSAEHIQRQYGIKEWSSDIDFLTQLAKQKGKLLKGGEPDLDNVAKSMIYDWQRGKLPFFVPPPRSTPVGGEGAVAGLLEDGPSDDDEDEEEEEENEELEEDEDSDDDDEVVEEEGDNEEDSFEGDSGVEDSGAEDGSVVDSEEESEEEEVVAPIRVQYTKGAQAPSKYNKKATAAAAKLAAAAVKAAPAQDVVVEEVIVSAPAGKGKASKAAPAQDVVVEEVIVPAAKAAKGKATKAAPAPVVVEEEVVVPAPAAKATKGKASKAVPAPVVVEEVVVPAPAAKATKGKASKAAPAHVVVEEVVVPAPAGKATKGKASKAAPAPVVVEEVVVPAPAGKATKGKATKAVDVAPASKSAKTSKKEVVEVTAPKAVQSRKRKGGSGADWDAI